MYFFDTYALIEIAKGSAGYSRFRNEPISTTLMNLFELHNYYLKELGRERADASLADLKETILDFDDMDIRQASFFRYFENKKGKKISYIDALGYVVAKKAGMKFLTGDEEFNNMENVEFVKG